MSAKIQDLEHVAAQPDFWDHQEEAQNTLQELNEFKLHYENYHLWRHSLEETQAIIELLELETDPALFDEAQENLQHLSLDLDT